MSLGLFPKVIFCRCPQELEASTCNKISSFCHVPANHVISVHDVNNIYHVPLLLMEQRLHELIATHLQIWLPVSPPQIGAWRQFAENIDNFKEKVREMGGAGASGGGGGVGGGLGANHASE
jgi:CTP synthase